MQLWELFVIAAGLSMDAFAVSICKGLSVPKVKPAHTLITGAWFGGFQALMPFIGYLLGTSFANMIESVDHWIAFVLLGIIGINMIREALSGEAEETDSSFGIKSMFPMAVATSIDALAVGVSFAFLKVEILPAVTFIGVITFVLSAAGVVIGNVFGARFKSKAELAGGIVLIGMGIKILIEHLFFQ
ncbi:MAG: manganese efflux pump [Clostridia bacterium]|nr:manganese efflux pump [Clostridia bacterium]